MKIIALILFGLSLGFLILGCCYWFSPGRINYRVEEVLWKREKAWIIKSDFPPFGSGLYNYGTWDGYYLGPQIFYSEKSANKKLKQILRKKKGEPNLIELK